MIFNPTSGHGQIANESHLHLIKSSTRRSSIVWGAGCAGLLDPVMSLLALVYHVVLGLPGLLFLPCPHARLYIQLKNIEIRLKKWKIGLENKKTDWPNFTALTKKKFVTTISAGSTKARKPACVLAGSAKARKPACVLAGSTKASILPMRAKG